jgi:hypothetical protein
MESQESLTKASMLLGGVGQELTISLKSQPEVHP